MPRLVDTTIRVLSKEPLAGLMPTAEVLRLAELLDRAGFAYLEVSGGGVFDTAVRRGVESPWERIRALKARTTTPLALALRGRFLVGSRPVGGDFAQRFVASAAQSGIEVFRLHDPLNDVDNLREAGEAIVHSGAEFEAGLLYGSGRHEALVDAAKRLPELGAARILLNDPAAVLQPHRASELVAELRDVSGLPVGLYAQGAGGNALAAALEAARAGADVIAVAVYPVALTMHRVSAEAAVQALGGLGLSTGVDIDLLWQAAELVDEHIGDEPIAPVPPRIAVRAAQRKLPVGLVGALDVQLRAQAAGDRLDEALDEVDKVRGEVGSPPLAAPIGRIVQETGVGEITIEEDGTRVSVRRTPEPSYAAPPSAVLPAETDLAPLPAAPRDDGLVRVESPMVGTFYRAPAPGAAPFVEEGDAVAPGQTLCILEAMKLMNEVKAEIEGVVRAIHVGNAEPVEYGQLLFELEPVNGRPLDAL